MYSVMRRLIFLLFTLLHTKSAISILVQDHGYHYQHQPSPILKPDFSSLFPLQSNPLSSHFSFPARQQPPPPPSLPSISLPSNNHHFSGNIHSPLSPIHFDIPPAVLHNFLQPHDEIYFSDDGRILKQYEVMERIIGDLQHPEHFLGPSPLLLDSLLAKLIGQNLPQRLVAENGQVVHPVTRNHGPIALGSGSLGYIQLDNGAAHLGSGSLGYISGQQASQAIAEAKSRKGLTPPGPLHFGHHFGN